MTAFINMLGLRFGKLKVIARADMATNGKTQWECRCDCGNTVVVMSNNLKSKTRSCGCLLKDSRKRTKMLAVKNSKFTIVKALIRNYKRSATLRNFSWDISDNFTEILIFSNCHYCGSPPCKQGKIFNTKTKVWRDTDIYTNGIDRVNNDLGYTKINCVPCCTICNYAKRDMSYEDFIRYLHRISRFRITHEAV